MEVSLKLYLDLYDKQAQPSPGLPHSSGSGSLSCHHQSAPSTRAVPQQEPSSTQVAQRHWLLFPPTVSSFISSIKPVFHHSRSPVLKASIVFAKALKPSPQMADMAVPQGPPLAREPGGNKGTGCFFLPLPIKLAFCQSHSSIFKASIVLAEALRPPPQMADTALPQGPSAGMRAEHDEECLAATCPVLSWGTQHKAPRAAQAGLAHQPCFSSGSHRGNNPQTKRTHGCLRWPLKSCKTL